VVEPGAPVPAPVNLPIARERPAPGFRHVLMRRDVVRFLELLEDWDELAEGLEGIRLAGGDPDCFGWYEPGLVVLGAWPRTSAIILDEAWVEESRPVLERLEVPIESLGGGRRRLEFDERSARGFLLLDVLLHELGHHHDRMHTRSQYECSRGEPYAMDYAERRTEELWERYVDAFGG
jgi:hypothetical protein